MTSGALTPALLDARRALDLLLADADLLARAQAALAVLVDRLRRGGKVMVCGNGGSACDAAHFAEELTGRFRADRPPIAAMACTDAGHITCVANDYGFEQVFARWVTGLGRPDDVLVVLSTSGNSPNLLRAVEAAGRAGMTTVALTGRGGGELRGRCTHELVFPGATSDRIQELHMLVLHAWCEEIERSLGRA